MANFQRHPAPMANSGMSSFWRTLLLAAPLLLAACGGGSGDPEPAGPPAPAGFSLASYSPKAYNFSWAVTPGAVRYELFEDPDGPGGPQPESQLGATAANNATSFQLQIQVPLYERLNATYRLRACDAAACGAFTAAVTPDPVQAIGYFKASNSNQGRAYYGASVALSGDGSTLAVGAPEEGSKATGINGEQADNALKSAGAVYVFKRSGTGWQQQAYIKASNNRNVRLSPDFQIATARFGASVSLSRDGNTLAVGAPEESSNARGVDGDQANDKSPGAGAAYVFIRGGDTWRQHAYIKASNTVPAADIVFGLGVFGIRHPAWFGSSVALSADGRTLAVGAPGDTSGAKGVDADQQDTTAPFAGAVYVFGRTSTSWAQKVYLKASNAAAQSQFGSALALSDNGTTLAVGARFERGVSSGINGDPAVHDSQSMASGAAYVFIQDSGGQWTQQAYVKASNPGASDAFGAGLALSDDGDTLAVGAPGESSSTAGINPAPGPRTLSGAGAAYLFKRSNATWSQLAFIKPGNPMSQAAFGARLSLSGAGGTLAVAAPSEAGGGRGFNANPADSSAPGAGAVYLFQQGSGSSTWAQKRYLKASNTDAQDLFGTDVALSRDASTMAVGAPGEGSLATGIQGNQADNSGAPTRVPGGWASVGAVYLY